jgi:uncharacterized membrane protein YkvA (DUF1232 family)
VLQVGFGFLAFLAFVWLLLLVLLLAMRPDKQTAKAAIRGLPDTITLARRLTTDRRVPRSARLFVGFLLLYLISPIDLIPDFIPVVGWIDDLVVTALVLHYLVRRAGIEVVTEHWPGTAEGLDALLRLLRAPLDHS